jgi:hypothetical protein
MKAANTQKELAELKDKFERNRLANEKYQTIISEVDKAIRNLQRDTN